jgi:hypothetical protein
MPNYTLKKKKFGGETNSTFLALIPKESNPSNFTIDSDPFLFAIQHTKSSLKNH